MRAWTLDSTDGPLQLSDVPEPRLRDGGAVLRVRAVQIPAYTRALITGARGTIPTPTVLGIGGLGRVDAVADDVFDIRPGDVVVATGLLASGRVSAPEEVLLAWTGIGGRGADTATTRRMREVWRDGMFAERALMPARTLVALPGADHHPDPSRLSFLPWLCIAAGAVERSGLQAGQTAAVIGASGQLGGAAVLVALARGAASVVALGRNAEALERLAHVSSRVRPVVATGDRTRDAAALVAAGGEPDVVVDALGAAPSVEYTMAGYDAVRPDGVMVLMGGVREALPIPYGDLMRRRLTLRGSWMATPETVLRVWNMIQRGVLDLGILDVRTVGLDDPDSALTLAGRSRGLDIVSLVP